MSTAARIDELRKKFEENPRRYFAPLANELRKAGDLTQAIALCREHLPKQPGHMSGYIVFGQALYESGGLDEARTVFEQALALDPENLIALHHLGHIAKQQGDTTAARRWYERALETDPRNDDIAHQLASLATPARPVARVTPPLGSDALTGGVSNYGTPAYPHMAIGLDATPTPDSALRAVDFDVVNAALAPATPPAPPAATPVFTPAFTPSVPAEPAPMDAAPLLDLDALESDGAQEIARDAAAEDPFAFDEPASAPSSEAAPLVDLDANFEEGLVAPEWPDTSDLVARVATPRSVTPASVEVTLDAVEAFGREPQDPVIAPLPLPEPEVLGSEADLRVGDLVPTTDADAAFELETERFEPIAFEPTSFAPAHDEPVASLPEETPSLDAGEELEDMLNAAAPSTSEELPWLAPSAATPDVQEEVGGLVEAMEDDARAMGEPESVSVTAWSPPEADPVEASFADVMPTEDTASMPEYADAYLQAEPSTDAPEAIDEAAADEPATDEPESDASPAFVTETMAELLVAQGFIARAVTVYEELVRRRPYDPVLSARLDELRAQAAAEQEPVPETTSPTPHSPAFEPVRSPTPAYATVSVYTARARFAALAARRVARRTPAAPVRAVPTPRAQTPVASAVIAADESLDALFGHQGASGDDHAAEALAQAFAPVDANTPLGQGLFESPAGRAPTPAFGTTRQSTPVRAPTPVAPMTATPHATTSAPTPAAGEFSFDRFFPDPAVDAAHQAPATPSAESAPAPKAGDDLAQFSAWLKGLGNP